MQPNPNQKIYKFELDNGLIILVRPTRTIPKVSTQLWYNVGSKDEKTGEKGIAHLIEHMIFKGTQKLSESDINMITQKLSGVCNAFTSYDYTGYLFDFPSHHWHEALPIMADCMRNCTFKQELLNSEMKAVIQELKMYRDNYGSSLIEHMISTIFYDHPYHFPIIGFKQDLWSLKRDVLDSFYKKHYYPNNATLVIVGDVNPKEVFALAKKEFGHIEPNPHYKKELFFHNSDLIATTTTLYRDVKIPQVALAFVVPGAHDRMGYIQDVLSWILGSGKSSRLQQRIVEELQLATQLETFAYDLFDKGLFFIYFQPKDQAQIEPIITIINQEINELITEGISDEELLRATKQVETEYLSLLENNQKQAYAIGQAYLATGDENYLFNYINHNKDEVKTAATNLLKQYFKPSLMHRGNLLPLTEQDRPLWLALQQESDAQDNRILSQIARETEVEEGTHVHSIAILKPHAFHFPKPTHFRLDNGLNVLYYHNPNIPKLDLVLEFKAKSYYDPENLQGLNTIMSSMLIEGTKNYSSAQLAHEVESRGMSLDTKPGALAMNMLSVDFAKGLEILKEVITHATFPAHELEKVRHQEITELQNYWDNPSQFIGYLARKELYGEHPYHKLSLGTAESLQAITREDLINAYKTYLNPQQATLVIVGDLEGLDIKKLVTDSLSDWQAEQSITINFPQLTPVKAHTIDHFINRDQIVLAFAGLSVSRFDKDFDKLFLFDQILTGGVLGSMNSRLFELRERSGLFYTISGSLLANADEQPGMVFIKTIVSADRLPEAEKQIKQTLETAADTISDEELLQAQNALISSMVDNFETNRRIAHTFAFLHRFGLPDDYFDTRAEQLTAITKEEIQKAARKVLNTQQLVTLRAGRL